MKCGSPKSKNKKVFILNYNPTWALASQTFNRWKKTTLQLSLGSVALHPSNIAGFPQCYTKQGANSGTWFHILEAPSIALAHFWPLHDRKSRWYW